MPSRQLAARVARLWFARPAHPRTLPPPETPSLCSGIPVFAHAQTHAIASSHGTRHDSSPDPQLPSQAEMPGTTSEQRLLRSSSPIGTREAAGTCFRAPAHLMTSRATSSINSLLQQGHRWRHSRAAAELANTDDVESAATSAGVCSHCGWHHGRDGDGDSAEVQDPFFCGSCQALMPVDQNLGHFAIFELEPQYEIDTSALEQKYKQLQRQLHPDKFASSLSKEDRERSAEWSTLVIGAYYTLLRPLSRARYLMRGLAGEAFDNAESVVQDQELLMEIMETRERVEEASAEELDQMKEEFADQLKALGEEFGRSFQQQDMSKCKDLVNRMTYCQRILEEITERL